MVNFSRKLLEKVNFYRGYLLSGFVNGGSWKLDRITELTAKETRRIIVRNMSTYDEIFSKQEQSLNTIPEL